jgi:5-methylcytosine-specific restriction endonuclease McrA
MAARNEVLDDYRRGAASRGLEWKLTDDEFDALMSSECFYCHRQPNTSRKSRRSNGDFTYNGIDRLDNNRGYRPANVVACCKICNRAKSDMTYDEFTDWLHDVSEAIHGIK